MFCCRRPQPCKPACREDQGRARQPRGPVGRRSPGCPDARPARGGASGVLLAAQLLRRGRGRVAVTILEKGARLGCGVAYSTSDPQHLLNTSVANMLAYPDQPEHFLEWLRGRQGQEVDPQSASSRGGPAAATCRRCSTPGGTPPPWPAGRGKPRPGDAPRRRDRAPRRGRARRGRSCSAGDRAYAARARSDPRREPALVRLHCPLRRACPDRGLRPDHGGPGQVAPCGLARGHDHRDLAPPPSSPGPLPL